MTEETARLDYSNPPPRHTLEAERDEFGDIVWDGLHDGETAALAASWAHYKTHNDPPGMLLWVAAMLREQSSPADEAGIRAAAWAWHDRRHTLVAPIGDRADDEPRDCEACGGEAVAPDVLSAHEAACEFFTHDILDDGGGRCNVCGDKLAPCPACGPYHGRQPPPDLWPRILTWTDEQVAEVERWLADSTAEMPEVLCG